MIGTRRTLRSSAAVAAAPYSPFGGNSGLLTNLHEFWNWNESSGTKAYGATSTYNFGTFGPNPENLSWVSGKVGNAARGTNAVSGSSYFGFICSSAACGRFTSSFTVTTWFKIHSNMWSGHFPIAEYASGSTTDLKWRIYLDNDADLLKFNVSSTGTSYGTTASYSLAPSLDTWYFVAAIFDDSGNTIKVSANDGTKASTAFSSTLYDATGQVKMCSDWNYYGNFSWDMTGMWTRALSDAEITALYNSGNGLAY